MEDMINWPATTQDEQNSGKDRLQNEHLQILTSFLVFSSKSNFDPFWSCEEERRL